MSGEAKVKTDARRYFKEAFPNDQASPEVVVIKGDSLDNKSYAMWIKALTKELKVEAEVVEAPVVATLPLHGPPRWWTKEISSVRESRGDIESNTKVQGREASARGRDREKTGGFGQKAGAKA